MKIAGIKLSKEAHPTTCHSIFLLDTSIGNWIKIYSFLLCKSEWSIHWYTVLFWKAWILWTKGTPLDLIDEGLSDSSNLAEVLRCIHVALLCVQQRPEDRPTMSTVVVMLGSENPLPQPKQPGFFMGKNSSEKDSSSSKHEAHSLNEVSLTLLEAR